MPFGFFIVGKRAFYKQSVSIFYGIYCFIAVIRISGVHKGIFLIFYPVNYAFCCAAVPDFQFGLLN